MLYLSGFKSDFSKPLKVLFRMINPYTFFNQAYAHSWPFSLVAYGNDRYTVDQSTKFGTVIP